MSVLVLVISRFVEDVDLVFMLAECCMQCSVKLKSPSSLYVALPENCCAKKNKVHFPKMVKKQIAHKNQLLVNKGWLFHKQLPQL